MNFVFENSPQMNANEREWISLNRIMRRVRLAAPYPNLFEALRCGKPHPTLASDICVHSRSFADLIKNTVERLA